MIERYDKCGRMKYNPEYHGNNGDRWSEEDLMYLCSMHGVISWKDLAMALERTETAAATKLYGLKRYKKELYDKYREMGKQM